MEAVGRVLGLLGVTKPSIAVVAVLAAVYICSLFRRLYPSPLPGIPCNAASRRRLFGDLPAVKRLGRRTGETSRAFFSLAYGLGTPLVQLLIPALAPYHLLVLTDPREVEDVLVRRQREFDRSEETTALFTPLLPCCTLAQLTTPALRAQKRAWSDVMSTEFLRKAVAPNILCAAMDLVDLWRARVKAVTVTPGRQADEYEVDMLDVSEELELAALDAIWVAVLGSKLGAVKHETEKVTGNRNGGLGQSSSRTTESANKVRKAMAYLHSIIRKAVRSPWPAAAMFRIKLTPTCRRMRREVDAELRMLMADAYERFQRMHAAAGEGGFNENLDMCAMDLVIRRQVLAAKKDGRPNPDPKADPAMLQELLLLLLAGHDSTSNTLSWFVKFIAASPEAQRTCRQRLQAAFPDATTSPPTAAQVLDAEIPWLDAVVEETIRLSATAGLVMRRAQVDTELLGHRVPAGTNIALSLFSDRPLLPVDEDMRSPTSRAAQLKRFRQGYEGEPGRNLHLFEPARWIYTVDDPDGKSQPREVFDANALPVLIFGGGLRGCFGRKLAYQELRIMMALLMLNFEFLPLPAVEAADMTADEDVFRRPKSCLARLRAL